MTYPKMGYEKLPNDCPDRDAREKERVGIGWPQTKLTASLIPGILHSWEQRCLSFRGSQHPLRSLLKHRFLGHPPEFLTQQFWGWGLEICIANKFPGGGGGGMQLVGATLWEPPVQKKHTRGNPTCGAFKVTPRTASAGGEGSSGRRGEDPPLGTSKISAVGGVSGGRETQKVLENRMEK